MIIWVAYNDLGDLVAEGCSEAEVLEEAQLAGYAVYEVYVGRVTP